MKWSAKRVESSGVPCLDAGSTPATSTLGLRFVAGLFFVWCARCCAQRRATMLPYVAEDCLPANKFSANNPYPRALRSRLCFVVQCSVCVGGADFIRGCRICGNQVPANDGFDWMSSNRPTPATSTLGLRFVAGLFFVWCARCCAQRRATMLPLYFSPHSPHSPHSPQKTIPHYSLLIDNRVFL